MILVHGNVTFFMTRYLLLQRTSEIKRLIIISDGGYPRYKKKIKIKIKTIWSRQFGGLLLPPPHSNEYHQSKEVTYLPLSWLGSGEHNRQLNLEMPALTNLNSAITNHHECQCHKQHSVWTPHLFLLQMSHRWLPSTHHWISNGEYRLTWYIIQNNQHPTIYIYMWREVKWTLTSKRRTTKACLAFSLTEFCEDYIKLYKIGRSMKAKSELLHFMLPDIPSALQVLDTVLENESILVKRLNRIVKII